MSCCAFTSNGQDSALVDLEAEVDALAADVDAVEAALAAAVASLSAPSSVLPGTVLWDYDLANEPTAIINTGDLTIDEPTWGLGAFEALRPAAGIALFQRTENVGIEFANDGSATTQFSATQQTAAHFYLPVSTIKTRFSLDDRARLQMDLHLSVLTLTGTSFVANAVHGRSADLNNGANRMVSTQRAFAAGNDISNYQSSSATSSAYTSAPGPTADVLTTMVAGMGNTYGAQIGVFGTSFDETPRVQIGAGAFTYTNTFGPFVHDTSRWAVAFATPTAVAGTIITARRMRLTYLGNG